MKLVMEKRLAPSPLMRSAGAGGGSFRRSGFLRYLFCSDGARSF